jgi:hypothetical protein
VTQFSLDKQMVVVNPAGVVFDHLRTALQGSEGIDFAQ